MEVSAPIGFLGGMGYLSYQFGGPAIVSILAGLACIALPLPRTATSSCFRSLAS